jgi:hypothetical protein
MEQINSTWLSLHHLTVNVKVIKAEGDLEIGGQSGKNLPLRRLKMVWSVLDFKDPTVITVRIFLIIELC